MSKQKSLQEAEFRVQVFQQCESSAELLNSMLEKYPRGSTDVVGLKMAKNALLFVITRRLDEFIEFRNEMNKGITAEQEEWLRNLPLQEDGVDDKDQ